MGAQERAVAPGTKRLLSIDGGGIRGVLALGTLGAVESHAEGGQRPHRVPLSRLLRLHRGH